MHGFYFQGAAVRPVFNRDQCYADLGGKPRVGLDIRDLGSGRYDVVLAGGQGFTGSALYFLNYGGDLASAGLIGWTKSASFGELFYFDWAPEQWDQPLEHRTVRVVLPISVPQEKVGAGSPRPGWVPHRAVREPGEQHRLVRDEGHGRQVLPDPEVPPGPGVDPADAEAPVLPEPICGPHAGGRPVGVNLRRAGSRRRGEHRDALRRPATQAPAAETPGSRTSSASGSPLDGHRLRRPARPRPPPVLAEDPGLRQDPGKGRGHQVGGRQLDPAEALRRHLPGEGQDRRRTCIPSRSRSCWRCRSRGWWPSCWRA